jgi:hypothetical protein
MCAMMPMFRVFANGDCLGITELLYLGIESSGHRVIDWTIDQFNYPMTQLPDDAIPYHR